LLHSNILFFEQAVFQQGLLVFFIATGSSQKVLLIFQKGIENYSKELLVLLKEIGGLVDVTA